MAARSKTPFVLTLLSCLSACHQGYEDIEVRGEGFYWTFVRAGADKKLGTEDDLIFHRELLIEQGSRVRLHIRSNDYIYTLRVPELDLNEVAVPDLTFTYKFVAERLGRYDLPVDPLCGVNFLHDNTMMGEIVVFK